MSFEYEWSTQELLKYLNKVTDAAKVASWQLKLLSQAWSNEGWSIPPYAVKASKKVWEPGVNCVF